MVGNYRKNHQDRELIVFVIIKFKPRYIKIARALKTKHYRLVFIMHNTEFNKRSRREVLQGIKTHFFGTPEEAMKICKRYNPLVYHVFAEKDYTVPYLLISNKEELGKIVYSGYDIFWGYYRNAFKKSAERAVKKERYCLENADGVCFRDWAGEFLEKESDYNISGKWIRFLDGCSGIPVRKRQNLSSELHLCYAGEVRSEKQFKDIDDTRLFLIAEKCEDAKVHLHVYPSVKNDEMFSTYISMSKNMNYFHFYEPLSYLNLIKKLSEYDYGIDCGNEKSEMKYITEQMFACSCANKYFDYLDAELPIITVCTEYQRKMFEEDGVCISADILDVDFDQLRNRREGLKIAVIQAKNKYAINNNIQKLIDFYSGI